MRKRRNRPHHDQGRDASPARALTRYPGCKLEDAKAHFSEVVRRAQSEGPQRVTVRGKDTAVVIRAVELERLLPQERKSPFVEFTESLYVEGFNLSREPDYGRDIEVIGWLLDTNFISTIINPNGAPTVKAWAATQNEKQVLSMYLRVGRV